MASPATTSGTTPPPIPDYELVRRIGQGSYGDVWLARGLTGAYRAIKVVWRDRFPNVEPFEREFTGLKKIMAIALPEAGQLALLHVGQNEAAGFFYYVMELADDVETGRAIDPARYAPLTLKEVKARRGRLPAAECVTFGIALARSLAGLHAYGLVHRDIKPSNIILVGGVPKLADIGLVTETADAMSYVGTEGFVPPEGPGKPAADVYALGRLLYELATGLDREEYPRLPPELNRVSDHRRLLELNEIILRACEPSPDRRYADAQAVLTDLLVLEAGQSIRRRSGRRRLLIAAAVVAVGAGAALFFFHPPGSATGPSAPPPATGAKSLAVLPFENMNVDKEDAFFADGIHEEIVTDLANIAALRVISRTSVMPYRGTTKKIGQIAKELGVDYILEGSVRRVGQKVRVTGQLIRAAVDEHIWAKAYDGDLSDVLALQAQVATAIAEQLKAVLSPAEAKRLTAFTLADPKAYELYLKGKDLRRRQFDRADPMLEAMSLFQRATELDPKFALPWVELASLHVWRFFQARNRGAERDLAKQAIDRALELAPDRAEVEAGLGEYFYYGFRDFESAAQHYRRAVALEPSNANVHNLLGLLARRQGRWHEALAELRRAHELDPLNLGFAETLITTLTWVHAYPEAKVIAKSLQQADPGNPLRSLDVAIYEANVVRSRRPIADAFAALTSAQRQNPVVKAYWRWFNFDAGQAAEYVRLVEAERAVASPPTDDETLLNLAMAQRTLGRDSAALLAELRERQEERVKINPDEGDAWAFLLMVCAVQGDRTRTQFVMQHFEEIIPQEKDLLNWRMYALTRVKAMAWLGDKEVAVALLTRLVAEPTAELHVYELKFTLDWWPLRGYPPFEALLADEKTYRPKY